MVVGSWQIADGWATEAEAKDHADKLREAQGTKYEFKVHHSGRKYGGGNWLVMYAHKDAGAYGSSNQTGDGD